MRLGGDDVNDALSRTNVDTLMRSVEQPIERAE
jgi:hypothetical protein